MAPTNRVKPSRLGAAGPPKSGTKSDFHSTGLMTKASTTGSATAPTATSPMPFSLPLSDRALTSMPTRNMKKIRAI